ncbi:serine/threonine-protein kinase STY46-like [Vigna angularis]|uniref:serine/threonine-protein kinase STY46-like n=1 Tax=Phaseolus angularis TaxID=3914 RepID=UPI000809A860|nr:serine/threonine-protein kinase STY46-like [Vigna angularis]
MEFVEQIGPNSYKGVYMGNKVGIEKLKGYDKGNSYKFELHKDLLELMTCGHRNILQFCDICVDDNHGLCVVTKFIEGGSIHDLMLKMYITHSCIKVEGKKKPFYYLNSTLNQGIRPPSTASVH